MMSGKDEVPTTGHPVVTRGGQSPGLHQSVQVASGLIHAGGEAAGSGEGEEDRPRAEQLRPMPQQPTSWCLSNPNNLCYLNSCLLAWLWISQALGQQSAVFGAMAVALPSSSSK